MIRNQFLNPRVCIIHKYVFIDMAPIHRFIRIYLLVDFEEDIQNRNQHHEGEYVQPLGYEIEHNRPNQISPVWFQVACHYGKKLFQHL